MSDSGPSKPPIRRPRKTPEQRGEVGWWAYRTMVDLGLSDVQIAARVRVGAPTIRKFMGSPEGQLGAESRKAMLAYFREVATTSKTPIDEPPTGFIMGSAGLDDTIGSADLASAIRELVEELRVARQERAGIEGRLRALEAAATLQAQSGGAKRQGRSTPPRIGESA